MLLINIVSRNLLKKLHLRTCVAVCIEYHECINNVRKSYIQQNEYYIQPIKKRFFTKLAVDNFRNFSRIPEKKDELDTLIKNNPSNNILTKEKLNVKTKILQDIKETKDKVRDKVEAVIERENIYTIPNLLCISRIILSPYLGMLIINAEFNFALCLLGIAAVTDLLDGWIARGWASQSTKIGSFLDPMADKVLIGTLFLTLTYADLIPIALTSLIIARDVLLILAGFVIRYRSLPPPRTLSRYFDATHATAQLAPTFISKVNTGVQLLLVGSTLAAPVFHYVGHPLLECLWYITGTTTVAAGLSYVISKNTYKFLKRN